MTHGPWKGDREGRIISLPKRAVRKV